MTFRLGLTGSIGMGKSTTVSMFADEGCAIWDADAAVHRFYKPGGAAVEPISKLCPQAIVDAGVSRELLKKALGADPGLFARLEAIVHPLVAQDRADFLAQTAADIAVLDIPLLFETGAERDLDATVCVSTSAKQQQQRVLARGTMTADQLQMILAKQMPDAEKRARADYVISTDTIEQTRQQVKALVAKIRSHLNA